MYLRKYSCVFWNKKKTGQNKALNEELRVHALKNYNVM